MKRVWVVVGVVLLFVLGVASCDRNEETAVPVVEPVPDANNFSSVGGIGRDRARSGAPGDPPIPGGSETILAPTILSAAPVSQSTLPEPVLVDLPPLSPYTPGETVEHRVRSGEWLLQIARCYGSPYPSVRNANAHIYNPNWIYPGTLVWVPNIGSQGEIVGAPCVEEYIVAAGDSWQLLAQRFETTITILQKANPGGLWAGRRILVPRTTALPGTPPVLSRDLLFVWEGDVAVWRRDDARLAVIPYPDAYILDMAGDAAGRWLLVRQVTDDNEQVALLNRETRVQSVLKSDFDADAFSESPFSNRLLVAEGGQWAAYLAGTAGNYELAAIPTANPDGGQSITLQHQVPEYDEPGLFPGRDDDHFIFYDRVGIFHYNYDLAQGGQPLLRLAEHEELTVAWPVAWSPDRRYLLFAGSMIEGSTDYVLDVETGRIAHLPESGGYVIGGATFWMDDGTVVVLSPRQDSVAPQLVRYRPESAGAGLDLVEVERRALAGAGTGEPLPGYLIAAPQYQSGALILALQGGPHGLWSVPEGGTHLSQLNNLPASFSRLHWSPEHGAVLAEQIEVGEMPGSAVYVQDDGSAPFSLADWLGMPLYDFQWLEP